MDNIFQEILNRLKSRVKKNNFFEHYIDYDVYNECIEFYKKNDYSKYLFRYNPTCKCDDASCSHKSSINTLNLNLMYNRFAKCVKSKDDNIMQYFNTTKVRNIKLVHLEYNCHSPMPDVYNTTCYIDGEDKYYHLPWVNIPYARYSMEEHIDEGFSPYRIFDIFEGIIFHKSIPKWIEFDLNGVITRFDIIGKKFMPNNFLIPLSYIFCTHLTITTDTPTTCKLIYGIINGNYSIHGIRKIIYDKEFCINSSYNAFLICDKKLFN